jgi:hypothetical protein
MTVLDASNRLWLWFSKNTSFCIDNLKDVVLIIESYDADLAAIYAALSEFEKANLVARSSVEKKEFWTLKRSFSTFEQNVAVSATTAQSIADLINLFGQTFHDDDWQADPLNIKEIDLLRITELTNQLLKKQIP